MSKLKLGWVIGAGVDSSVELTMIVRWRNKVYRCNYSYYRDVLVIAYSTTRYSYKYCKNGLLIVARRHRSTNDDKLRFEHESTVHRIANVVSSKWHFLLLSIAT
jgi:hypothetical protein